jgi:hypothetical protein
VYTLSHAVHFSHRCLYVLLWKPYEALAAVMLRVAPWLESLCAHVPDAHVVLVASHCKTDIREEEFLELSGQVEAAARAKVEELNDMTRLEVDKLRTQLATVMGIVLCRLEHAATQTLWPLILLLHLLLPSLVSSLPLPSFLSAGLSSLSLSSSPPVACQAGVTWLTMSAIPGQWASAIVVGDGEFAGAVLFCSMRLRLCSIQYQSPARHGTLLFAHFPARSIRSCGRCTLKLTYCIALTRTATASLH